MKIGGDQMTTEFMRDLLSKDEKITVEYKTCQFGIQEDVYETVCSFPIDMVDILLWGQRMMVLQ